MPLDLYEVTIATPRDRSLHILTTAASLSEARRQVEAMIREFEEEAILSGRTSEVEHYKTEIVTIR